MYKVWSDQTKGMKVIVRGILIMLCLFMMFILPAGAAEKKKTEKGPRPVGVVNSSNGGVYKTGQYGIILKYINFRQDQLYNGTDKLDYAPPKKGKKCYEKTMEQFQLILRTGIYDNFEARLIIPFFDKEMKRESTTRHFYDESFGIGDIKLMGRYQIWSQKKRSL